MEGFSPYADRRDRRAVLVWLIAVALVASLAWLAHQASRSLAHDLRAVADAADLYDRAPVAPAPRVLISQRAARAAP